ncbi:hypothetical protein Kim5_PA00036 (plasmid) [Rhizobium sp. Kim5]|nr:hypothetical protein Kim5_PA00036 [Rhizobium sp. Kim5]
MTVAISRAIRLSGRSTRSSATFYRSAAAGPGTRVASLWVRLVSANVQLTEFAGALTDELI